MILCCHKSKNSWWRISKCLNAIRYQHHDTTQCQWHDTVCVCVHACVNACVHACVCICVCVTLQILNNKQLLVMRHKTSSVSKPTSYSVLDESFITMWCVCVCVCVYVRMYVCMCVCKNVNRKWSS